METFYQFALLGLGAGGTYALMAIGVVLVYRGSGVLNFAAGSIAMSAAFLFYELHVLHSWSAGPALVVSLLACALFGLAIHHLIMRPLRNASNTTKTIATLGLVVVLQSLAVNRYPDPLAVPSMLPIESWSILGVNVGSDRIIICLISIAIAIALYLGYRHLAFGRQTLAVAESRRSAAALGYSPDHIAGINWALGAMLNGLAGILIVPISGLSPAGMAELVVPAFAAAVLGGMASFPLTLVGGIGIGITQSEVANYVHIVGFTTFIPFALVIFWLVFRGRGIPDRSQARIRLPAVGGGRIRFPVFVGWLVVAVLLLTLLPAPWQTGAIVSITFGIVLLSIVVVTGYAGQLSLAQYALAGFGALIAAHLTADWNWPFELCILAAAVTAIPIGIVVGLPALRTRGLNLAVVTLALSLSADAVFFNNPTISGGFDGILVGTPTFFGTEFSASGDPGRYALLTLGFFILLAFGVSNVRRSRVGRRLIAVRTNERAAAALGINPVGAKLFAFSFGGVIAAVAGVLLAFQLATVLFTPFTITESQAAITAAVIGGVGFIAGAVLGSMLEPGGAGEQAGHWFGSWVASNILTISGIGLLINLMIAPDGLIALKGPALRALLRKLGSFGRAVTKVVFIPSTGLPPIIESTRRSESRSLIVSDLSVRFGGVKAVDGVSLAVAPGEIVGLIGPNGAGKTTVIDAITGFVRPSGGTIHLGDLDLGSLPAHRRARAGVSRSFQSLELFEDVTVMENLMCAADQRDARAYVTNVFYPGRQQLTASTAEAISEFQLEPIVHTKIADLPYATRRLIAVARAVASDPEIVLLDEPASGLGASETRELGNLIVSLARNRGVGVLLIEHDVDLVMSICDRIVTLDAGKPIAEGTPEEIRKDKAVIQAYMGGSETPEEETLVGSDPADRVALEPTAESTSANEVIEPSEIIPLAARATRIPSPSNGAGTPPILQAQNLSAGYGSIAVIRDVNIDVRPGEIVALLGANGAGKTTTLLTLAGELRALQGTVSLDGVPITGPLHARARQGLAFVSEERSVFMGMSTSDNLKLGSGGIANAVEIMPPLGNLLRRKAGLLSGGEQQMLTLARAIASTPKVLLVDELSLGLAPLITSRLFETLRAAADDGVAVLLVEQHVRRALEIADRGYVMRRGEIILEGTAPNLLNQLEEIEHVYLSRDETTEPTIATTH